jgi:peptidyl-tRNA hydrolase, PTH1 family
LEDLRMKLIVGIGNPGPRFAGTRHNIGFEVLDAFASKYGFLISESRFEGDFGQGVVAGVEVGLLKPATFVNRSGLAVKAALAAIPEIEFERDLVVVFDDLDLPFGQLRLREAGGAGGHRGIADIIDTLESRAFARMRFGIGRPSEGMSVRDYVLQKFGKVEEKGLTKQIAMSVRALESLLADGVEVAMSHFNRESGRDD